MQLTKHGWGAVISIFILVPLLFKLSALLPVPTLYSGITQDLLILLLFLLLNHFWFKIPIKWWHSQSLAHQSLQLIPGIIILLLPMTSNYIKLFQLARTPILGFYIGYTLLIGITEEYLYRGYAPTITAKSWYDGTWIRDSTVKWGSRCAGQWESHDGG